MPFQKGREKTGGRKPGVKNKKTVERLEAIERVIKLIEENLDQDVTGLKKNERTQLWKDLQEYILPKQQRANQDGDQSVNINITIDSDDSNL